MKLFKGMILKKKVHVHVHVRVGNLPPRFRVLLKRGTENGTERKTEIETE
jgi:hypothetical protein